MQGGAERVSLINRLPTLLLAELEAKGEAVPPDRAKTIFDSLYSAKATGTGLGLSIAARIFRDARWSCAVQERLVAEAFGIRTAAHAIQ